MSEQPHIPRSSLRAAVRAVLFVVVTLVLFVPVLLCWMLTLERLRGKIVQYFYAIIGWITGLRVRVEGMLSSEKPLMLVANHSSYLDIFVLGGMAPVSFAPKLEIRSWPVIGFFCVLADCVFIERKPADMQRAQAEMAERLQQGKRLVLFPEGTTGNGLTVIPFKSGFLSLAEEHHLPIQPVSIAYTHIGAVPLSAATREQVVWIGEASLVDHFWRLLQFPKLQVVVTLYPVERQEAYEDRKELARACETIIREGLRQSLEAHGVTS